MSSTLTGLINVIMCPFGLRLGAYFFVDLPMTTLTLELDSSASPKAHERVNRMRRFTQMWYRSFGCLFFWFVGVYGTTTGVMQSAGVVD